MWVLSSVSCLFRLWWINVLTIVPFVFKHVTEFTSWMLLLLQKLEKVIGTKITFMLSRNHKC